MFNISSRIIPLFIFLYYFIHISYRGGNKYMSRVFEERQARNNYKCESCLASIPAGTQYICVTEHEVYRTPTPRKLYSRQYFNTHHINKTYRYHIGCEPNE